MPSRAVNSRTAKMASRVETCSLMTSPSVCRSRRNPDCRAACSIEVLLELDVGPSHHSFAAEKQHGQLRIPCHHCPHLVDARFLEFARDRVEHCVADVVQAHLWLDRQSEYPAAGRRAEFPGANLADDKSQHVRIRFVRATLGHQEETLVQPPFAVTNEYIVPVFRLGELRDPGVESDQ